MGEARSVAIAVCTCGRAALADTLASIAAQAGLADARIEIIVADNAATPQSEATARAAQCRSSFPVRYLHAPARNISVARNACLDAAASDWIAFIDDDETASPRWLAELLAEAEVGGWDAVLGPVEAIYPPDAPRWIRDGDFHSTRPVWLRGLIETGYCGNVLIRRAFVERAGLRFDPALGRSGGEDGAFFHNLSRAGGRIGFAARACAWETAPAERLGLAWLVKRRFRAGQTHANELRRRARGVGALGSLILATLKLGACALAALLALGQRRRNGLVVRAALHLGVMCRLLGAPMVTLY